VTRRGSLNGLKSHISEKKGGCFSDLTGGRGGGGKSREGSARKQNRTPPHDIAIGGGDLFTFRSRRSPHCKEGGGEANNLHSSGVDSPKKKKGTSSADAMRGISVTKKY